MKKFKQLIVAAAILVSGFGAVGIAQPVGAVNAIDQACTANPGSTLCASGTKGETVDSFLKTLINTLLYIVGILAVIMIIAGGIMYVISAGDSNKVGRAKNMLLYAVVGLVVAFLAYAIVNWVLGELI